MPSPKLTFRVAQPHDKVKLLELEQEVVAAERPYNQEIKSDAHYYDLESLLTQTTSHVIVAEVAEQIIATGYIDIRPSKQSLVHKHHGYLGFMYVDPKHRGQAINKQLMERLIKWARTQNVHHFYLDVYAQNQAAINAYEKLGFEPCLLEMKLVDI